MGTREVMKKLLGIGAGLAVGLIVALPASAMPITIWESDFSDFSADWSVASSSLQVDQGTDTAMLTVIEGALMTGGDSFGRALSTTVTFLGYTIDELLFEVDVAAEDSNWNLVNIAYFGGNSFLSVERLFGGLPSGKTSRTGAELTAPVGADGFKFVVEFGNSARSMTLDNFLVQAPEPSTALLLMSGLVGFAAMGRGRR